jgi:hypothetical protein
MKTEFDVEDAIYLKLSDVRPLFKGKVKDDYNAPEFTVINTLGVPADPIQEVEVNVNTYAADIQEGIADRNKLKENANKILNHLNHFNNDVFDIEYTFGTVIREEEFKRHFFNLRFKLIFINN